jgi:hypothetical protein
LVDLLSLTPTTSIINFYSANSTHLNLFDAQHGLWEQLARKIFCWGALDVPGQQGRLGSILASSQKSINWKREFRIASFIRDKLHQASFTKCHNPDLVEIKSSHHFKGITPLDVDFNQFQMCSTAVLQSDSVLYPQPIGNFSTAYFEVELITKDESAPATSIGGALKWFASHIGTARSSYGMNTNADVSLESDFTPLSSLTSPLEHGDIMGFGINFAKNSVFFTKNGNLLFETAQNTAKLPLQNLKNLHASISTVRDEVKVNMGSHPFEFDLLKYQQSNDQPKIPLKLFSETIVPHLIAFQDDDYLENSPISSYYLCDRNLPQPPFYMLSYLYLITYGVPHLESKIEIPSQDLFEFEYFRMLLNSLETFKSLDPVSDEAQMFWKQKAPILEQEYPGFKSMSRLEKVVAVERVTSSIFHERCLHFAGLYADELVDNIKVGESILATKELFFMQRPDTNGETHWTKELMRKALDPENKFPNMDNLRAESMADVLRLRFGALQNIIMQRCKQISEEKTVESDIMNKISCGDNLIRDNYKTILQLLASKARGASVPNKPSPYEPIDVRMDCVDLIYVLREQIQPNDEKEFRKRLTSSVIYGIYKLKVSPDNFSSVVEYLVAVNEENAKLITKDLVIKYLEAVARGLPTFSKLQLTRGPLMMIFGFKFDGKASVEDIRIEAGWQIEALLKKYRASNDGAKPSRSTFGQRTILIGAAVVGLIGAGLIGFMLSQKKLRK